MELSQTMTIAFAFLPLQINAAFSTRSLLTLEEAFLFSKGGRLGIGNWGIGDRELGVWGIGDDENVCVCEYVCVLAYESLLATPWC